MQNFLLWILLLLINFIGILLSYKFFKKAGLFVWIAIAAILANIQVIKFIELFSMTTTLGNIIYGTSFLATDILNEKYGKKEAQKGIYIGIFTLIITTVIMQICLYFIPLPNDAFTEEVQSAFSTIFGFLPRIALASVIAYVISQLHDVWAFDKLKNKFPKSLWIRNNFSTMISQLIDNVIFHTIAFAGLLAFNEIFEIFIVTYIMKFIVASLDTPFIYIAKKINT